MASKRCGVPVTVTSILEEQSYECCESVTSEHTVQVIVFFVTAQFPVRVLKYLLVFVRFPLLYIWSYKVPHTLSCSSNHHHVLTGSGTEVGAKNSQKRWSIRTGIGLVLYLVSTVRSVIWSSQWNNSSLEPCTLSHSCHWVLIMQTFTANYVWLGVIKKQQIKSAGRWMSRLRCCVFYVCSYLGVSFSVSMWKGGPVSVSQQLYSFIP